MNLQRKCDRDKCGNKRFKALFSKTEFLFKKIKESLIIQEYYC
jgi:hypothetical protein